MLPKSNREELKLKYMSDRPTGLIMKPKAFDEILDFYNICTWILDLDPHY